MFRVLCLLITLFPILFYGCGDSSGVEIGKPSVIPPKAPLSIEEWKAISDHHEKFDIDTLEHLRKSDPELESDKAWKKFMDEVVGPEMKNKLPLKESI